LSEKLTASFGFRYLAIKKDARQAVRTGSIDHVDGAGPLVDARWLNLVLAPLLLGNTAYLADQTNYVLTLGDGTQISPVLVPSYIMVYNIVSAVGRPAAGCLFWHKKTMLNSLRPKGADACNKPTRTQLPGRNALP
jgi:hypothetical protein